jgi:hypothetical protein
MTNRRLNKKRTAKRGLILLIVLGMLAMFTLLAVTYVVSAGASKDGSRALAVKARRSSLSVDGFAKVVLKDALRGTNNQKSAFYGNSIIGDVFGPNPIRTSFGPYLNNNSVRFFDQRPSGLSLVKLSINEMIGGVVGLSPYENEYNSRILTVLEGPLAGQSFRILKYVGYANNGSGTDPNMAASPWAGPTAVQADANDIRYSVLIDLNEIKGAEFTGEYTDADGVVRSKTVSIDRWISEEGIGSLFYFKTTAAGVPPVTGTMQGYKLLINDAAFNSPGIGLEDIAVKSDGTTVNSGFGNLDGRRLLATSQQVPLALLTHYDYLQDPSLMALNPSGTAGVEGLGNMRREWTSNLQYDQLSLKGWSNEGIDVADYRDAFLANQSFAGGQLTITPSYHRPEVINYISHLYGDPTLLLGWQVQDLIRYIDASTARVLSYPGKNEGFAQNDPRVLRLPSNFTWSSPPTSAEIGTLRAFVQHQITGELPNGDLHQWDVDNNGDSFKDSVWVETGLAAVNSPDGRRLRPLAAILIEDLDGRVNLNASGDRAQGGAGFNVNSTGYYKRANQPVAQGFGYGPAEISLTALFGLRNGNTNTFSHNWSLMTSGPALPAGAPHFVSDPPYYSFSFFDQLSGARRYRTRPIDFRLVPDRVPGIPRSPAAVDTSYSTLSEREFHLPTQHGRLPGMPIARRGTFGMSYDRNGNPIFVNPPIIDANPYNIEVAPPHHLQVDFANETLNDRYESAVMGNPIADDPLGLADLEAVLRRFDEDASSLPQRLREILNPLAGSGLLDSIYSEVTTRSGELRYPNLAAAMKVAPLGATSATQVTLGNEGVSTTNTTDVSVPSYLRYIQMLHSQRYRVRSFPPDTATDDPEISYAALSELFPTDFARGLRMDLNRPFGNGFDDDLDGQVDEPQEVTLGTETEYGQLGFYIREMKTDARKTNATVVESNANSNPFTSANRFQLGSRQILARNLYCLAQLIIPRDYEFPGMNPPPPAPQPDTLGRARIRATAIAQWAVNVVDFRDADAAMTRFEFDILPFGSNTSSNANFGNGTPGGLPAKLAYWAPDRIQHNNKQYCGVVWGMEMPELLLTESFAMHDTRIRDTDMEGATGNLAVDETDPAKDFDQYRLPQASLFLELYNPRTTDVANNALIPGVPSSLYDTTSMELDLDRFAPASADWGAQPVWRIAISEAYTPATSANHPQTRLTSTDNDIRKAFDTVTHQRTTEGVLGGTAPTSNALRGASDPSSLDHTNTALQNIEQYIGNDLRHDLSDTSHPADSVDPVGFERFVWFTGTRPTAGQRIPDIHPDLRRPAAGAGAEHASVYSAQSSGASLAGGSYLVIGPRAQTSFGSLSHNQFNGNPYSSTTLRASMTTPENRPQLSPSFQRIDLVSGANPAVNTYMLNNVVANQPWMGRIKQPEVMICSTTAPSGWAAAFPGPNGSAFQTTGAVGLNISYPFPRADRNAAYWATGRVPTERLNSTDVAGGTSRPDNSSGFGTMILPEDSWADLGVDPVVGAFPDAPYDLDNPLMTESGALPADDTILRQTRTLPNVRAAYLQRLADPEFPYDPVSNPYITVDWMSIDLTVFNGEAPRDTTGAGTNIQMQARYKNGELSPLATTANPHAITNRGVSYYSPMTAVPRRTVEQAPPSTITVPGITDPVNPDSYVKYQLGFDRACNWSTAVGSSGTSLGYCNVGYPTTPSTTPALTNAALASANWSAFDGFGPPIDDPTAINAFRGAPARIAGATWFNRPFASPYEIMMVPLTGPGQFGLYHSAYSLVQGRETSGFIPSFQTSNAWNVNQTGLPASLNCYWAKPQAIVGGEVRLADWPLLLEFIETQPGFIDANQHYSAAAVQSATLTDSLSERFLNSFIPAAYTRPRGMPNDVDNSEPSTVRGPSLLAPFHYKPTYVAAGKINLNTISFDSTGNSRALRALEYNYLASERNDLFNTIFQGQFAESRQGYANGSVPANAFLGAQAHPAMHPDFPTRYVGAFRPAMSSNIAPALANPLANARIRSTYGVETTLLRSLEPFAPADTSTPRRFYANERTAEERQKKDTDTSMLFQSTVQSEVGNVDQDILNEKYNFVRMQRAMRLPNLVTNQSNVFAVWVTVSLFEYDPIAGYGNEYVGDDGLPKRERQFFIVDRTIPVGFKPGEDLNTDRTILLQRKLP